LQLAMAFVRPEALPTAQAHARGIITPQSVCAFVATAREPPVSRPRAAETFTNGPL